MTRPNLALIVGAARSGTTLTRLLLDAHPEIGCPAEAGLPSLMGHLANVWATVNSDMVSTEAPDDPGVGRREGDVPGRWQEPEQTSGADAQNRRGAVHDLPMDTRTWIAETVGRPMTRYCEQGKKRVYCDKSLDSVYHLELVREVFPEVRIVLVFRHVMDTVASGIEASPWGFPAYGYTPYIQTSPGNSVAVLASYWLDHVDRALAWEAENPAICHRVRYEELVVQPEETISAIQRFLGVAEDLSVLKAAFERTAPQGPGDYKVEHTTGVHAASIGHGKRVPVALLPPALMKALNDKLERLGYEPLDRGWNAAERLVDVGGSDRWARRLEDMMSCIAIVPNQAGLGSFAVVAEDSHTLRWVVEPIAGTVEPGDGKVEAVLTGTAEDLVLLLTAEENLGVLLRSGRVRHVVAQEVATTSRELESEVKAFVHVLRQGLTGARAEELVAR